MTEPTFIPRTLIVTDNQGHPVGALRNGPTNEWLAIPDNKYRWFLDEIAYNELELGRVTEHRHIMQCLEQIKLFEGYREHMVVKRGYTPDSPYEPFDLVKSLARHRSKTDLMAILADAEATWDKDYTRYDPATLAEWQVNQDAYRQALYAALELSTVPAPDDSTPKKGG